MTNLMRSALLRAGYISIFFMVFAISACGGPDRTIDGGACQNDPRFCPPDDSGMGGGDGGTCIVMGTEAGNCSDGIDNDCDGDTDSGDADCGGTCPGFAIENTLALCTDGLDNDCNGTKDNGPRPGMDPNCEPFSCTPGTEPGPDLAETLHRPGQCYDPSWVETVPGGPGTLSYAEIMAGTTPWHCCEIGNPINCFDSTMGFGFATDGYESTGFFQGGAFMVESNRVLARYESASNNAVLTFAADGASAGYVQTIDSVTREYTCL